jgi:transposase
MPEEYGSYATAWRRLRRLQETGVWGRIMEFLKSMRRCERLAIDSTTMEAKRGGGEVGYDGFTGRGPRST